MILQLRENRYAQTMIRRWLLLWNYIQIAWNEKTVFDLFSPEVDDLYKLTKEITELTENSNEDFKTGKRTVDKNKNGNNIVSTNINGNLTNKIS